jgi:hypothetical protein
MSEGPGRTAESSFRDKLGGPGVESAQALSIQPGET